MRKSIYVGNLVSMGVRELEDLLSRFGVVCYAAVVAGDGSADGRPFGVVEMQAEGEARSAIRVLDGFEIDGELVTVRWATPPEQTAGGHPAMFGTMNLSGDGDDPGAP